ncbi:hypothetical protein DSM51_16875, partial [Salmonella enterica subsp. arizonae]|nr:hypothetical protein [Salmonella enterica subsp. arizonae]EDU4717516.1 hypothetical protein [Salmonella enterica subsp. arizonae]
LPEQFPIIGKRRAHYPVVTLCHVCGVHHSSYKCWKNASLLQIKKQQRGAAVSKSSLINAM